MLDISGPYHLALTMCMYFLSACSIICISSSTPIAAAPQQLQQQPVT